MFSLIAKFMGGSQDADPAVQRIHTPQLLVTTQQGALPAHADGETLCIDGNELSVTLLPNQIDLIYEP